MDVCDLCWGLGCIECDDCGETGADCRHCGRGVCDTCGGEGTLECPVCGAEDPDTPNMTRVDSR